MEFILVGGLGDHTAATGVLREVSKAMPCENIRVFEPKVPELWELNPRLGIGNGENGKRVVLNLGAMAGHKKADHAVRLAGEDLGIDVQDTTPEIFLSREEREEFHRGTKPRVTIDPWSLTVSHWPTNRWNEITEQLMRNGIEVIEVGNARQEARPLHCDLSYWGKLPLRKTMALISSSSCYLGHDSGLFHLAAAVGVPQVVVFSDVPSWRRAYRTTIAFDGLTTTTDRDILGAIDGL